MRVYVGQTRSRRLIGELAALGFGECFTRSESIWPPRRHPWFLDNGAFGDWKHGRAFDAAAFESSLISASAHPQPADFVVAPDRVAGGLESLEFSLRSLDTYAPTFPALRWYLVLQDGMTPADVAPALPRFSGVFVGGTLEWKIQTGAQWVEFGAVHNRPVHIGRVGTAKRVRWARRIGASSIDSALPLWSADKLRTFVAALECRQMELL